mmetsp:Transcript_34156/g.89455  ORF Transcript_34156/g.89455 Transcript_34156/m.89455 type:complete len:200 (-) Transcript_34156:171-770(-)
MHAAAEHRVGALEDGAERHLRRRREVADGADVAGDVLGKTDDALRATVAAFERPKFTQGVRQEQHLLEVGTLVGVDALREGAAHERDGMVLVIALAISQDRISWQLHAHFRQLSSVCIFLASAVNEAAEVAAPLHGVHEVSLAERALELAVDERDLEAVWELLEHAVGVRELGPVEKLVHLHGHQACEAVAGVPDTLPR